MSKNCVDNFQTGTKKRHDVCVVSWCGTSSLKNPDLTFHTIPREGQYFVKIQNKNGLCEKHDQRSLWINILKLNPGLINSRTRICSRHFCKVDYTSSFQGNFIGNQFI